MKFTRDTIFFDLETTGVEEQDRIFELYAYKVPFDKKDSEVELHLKINPEKEFTKEATEKTGMSLSKCLNFKTFSYYASEIFNFFKDCDLVGYNIKQFDVPFLKKQLIICGYDLDIMNVNLIDCFEIHKKLMPQTLSNVYKIYTGRVLENAHAANSDVFATIDIFKAQMKSYTQFTSMEDIHNFLTDGKKYIDSACKIYEQNGLFYLGFGKNKDKEIKQLILNDLQYIDWLIMKSDLQQETKNILKIFKDEYK